mmetsp:Transcript_19377/g.73261  ORF Transcript_19377/g.73261 Transcript_19377/m.73261 type:complete len:259 (+) Transcript_19377:1371-2147(+)
MTRSASENSAIAICSRVAMLIAKDSRCMLSAASTAPPPATRAFDSSIRFTTMSASCSARSISSTMYSLAPRRTSVQAAVVGVPRMYSSSPSPTRSSLTDSAWPRYSASNASFPSRSARVLTICPPVARATRRMSSIFTRRHAIAPASTKYFRHRSSMPLEQRMTLAPASRTFWMRSLVMSISRLRMPSTSCTSVTTTETPICSLWRCRLKSSSAMRAFSTKVGIPCAARELLSAKPLTSSESSALFPWHFKTWIALTG